MDAPAVRAQPSAFSAWVCWANRSRCSAERWPRVVSDGRRCFRAWPSLVAWAIVFGLLARNARTRPARPVSARWFACSARAVAWWLGAFYFLTFGGFVAFSIYLPTLLRAQFGLTAGDAGFRAAGFVVLATLVRPLGGWLADRIGGAQVLSWVFSGVAGFSLLLAWPSMVPFTVGRLLVPLLGLGNGAVFKLVPERFPRKQEQSRDLLARSAVLGGFFPPLLLGVFRDRPRHVLAGFSVAVGHGPRLRVANQRVFHPAVRHGERRCRPHLRQFCRSRSRRRLGRCFHRAARGGDRRRLAQSRSLRRRARRLHVRDAVRDLRHHLPLRDVAAAAADADVLAARLAGVPHAAASSAATCSSSAPRVVVDFAANRFIFRRGRAARARALADHVGLHPRGARSRFRWSGAGSTSRPSPATSTIYRTFVFGFAGAGLSRSNRSSAFVVFHGLVWASFLVIAGVMLAFRRRMIDHGAVAVQQFGRTSCRCCCCSPSASPA